MNVPARVLIGLIAAAPAAMLSATQVMAQCEACPTPVVAYQPVVTPVSPSAITGWYPGKLLDTWAANRAAYRTAAREAATTAYRPLTAPLPTTAYRPVTAYRPFATSFQSAFMPVTTAYSPITTYRPVLGTTAYSPVASAAACCDPCSTGTVSSYAPAGSACCGVDSTTPAYGGNVTPQPMLNNSSPQSSYYGPVPADDSATNANENERSLIEQGGTNGGTQNQNQGQQQQGGQQNGQQGASFSAPQLLDSGGRGLPEQPPADLDDHTANANRTAAVPALHKQPVQPQLVTSGSKRSTSKKGLPSRAERDAGWTAVSR